MLLTSLSASIYLLDGRRPQYVSAIIHLALASPGKRACKRESITLKRAISEH